MRVALFGGTFDPVHRGHLAIAAAAANAFALDRVIFAPVGRQPLKAEPARASFGDRLAMVELALRGVDPGSVDRGVVDPGFVDRRFVDRRFVDRRFEVSEMDRPRQDGAPNYTVDLLDEMRRARPMDDLFAIAGADSFLTLRQWKDPDRLLALAEWIVVSRPGFLLSDDELRRLELSDAQRGRVHVLSDLKEEVSATELRRRLAAGEDCADLLPPPVEEYVRERGLYR